MVFYKQSIWLVLNHNICIILYVCCFESQFSKTLLWYFEFLVHALSWFNLRCDEWLKFNLYLKISGMLICVFPATCRAQGCALVLGRFMHIIIRSLSFLFSTVIPILSCLQSSVFRVLLMDHKDKISIRDLIIYLLALLCSF